MPSTPPEDTQLLIRCPACRQRFKVDEALFGRTVECGGCDNRFRIDEDVVVRGRKLYPGERSSPLLNRLQKIPLSSASIPVHLQPITYGLQPDPAVLEPMSPQRVMAGAFGVAAMLLMSLILISGSNRGGVLDGMPLFNQLLVAGFFCVLGTVALIYANPKARRKALGVALVLSAGVLSIPFLHPGEASRDVVAKRDTVDQFSVPPVTEEDPGAAMLKTRIGIAPLVAENDRLAAEGSSKRAIGLWLRGLSGSRKFLIRDYILRVTGADPTSHLYPRDDGDYLFVVTGVTHTLQELAELTAVFGNAKKIYGDISVIEVVVDPSSFVEGPIEKLRNKQNPAFYELNKRELESIDLERAKRAVQRLSEVEPKVYRADITRKLIELLSADGVTFKDHICVALAVWSENPGVASEAALKEARKLTAAKAPIPPEMIALIVKEQNLGVIPLLDELWLKNSNMWESHYGDLGKPAEAAILKQFEQTSGNQRYSAVRILGRVGTQASLPVLEAVQTVSDPELRVLLDQSMASIRKRLN